MISDLGGVGKSRLARAYVEEALIHNAYEMIFWFQLNREMGEIQNKSSLQNQYRGWLNSINEKIPYNETETYMFTLFFNKLSQNYKYSLLVYDDVPSGDFLKGLLPQTNVHILITSRDTLGWKPIEMIPALEGFQAEE